MIGLECKHLETGHMGIITQELKGDDKTLPQWGVCWYDGRKSKEHADRNRKGIMPFWQAKDKIGITNYPFLIEKVLQTLLDYKLEFELPNQYSGEFCFGYVKGMNDAYNLLKRNTKHLLISNTD